MNIKLEQMLTTLKKAGFPTSRIESELNFSNGLLGKARKGKTNLSEEKFKKLEKYHEQNKLKSGIDALKEEGLISNASTVPKNTPDVSSIKMPEWATEIEAYCFKAGILPSDLINTHKGRNKAAIIKKPDNADDKSVPVGDNPVGFVKPVSIQAQAMRNKKIFITKNA